MTAVLKLIELAKEKTIYQFLYSLLRDMDMVSMGIGQTALSRLNVTLTRIEPKTK